MDSSAELYTCEKSPLRSAFVKTVMKLLLVGVIETLSLIVDKEEQLVSSGSGHQGCHRTYSSVALVSVSSLPGPLNLFSHWLAFRTSLRKNSHTSPWNRLVPDLIGGIHDSALKIAELGGGVGGNQVEFLDRVGRRRNRQQVIRGLVVVHPVEDEVVGLLAISVDVWTAAVRSVVTVVEG